ncbi:MAG: hypothetical protein RSF40_01350 [Oscillospiraceae bacterium]
MVLATVIAVMLVCYIIINNYYPTQTQYIEQSNRITIKNTERVLCAAIWIDDGNTYVHQPTNIESGFVVCGWRHGCCFEQLKAMERKYTATIQTQGFLTSKNRFLGRAEAREFVLASGQLDSTEFGNELYSEDLY